MAAPHLQSQGTINPPEEPAPFQLPATSGSGRIQPAENQDLRALDLNAAVTVSAVAWPDARPGKCYQNVNRFVIERGGGFASGWALADSGPMVRNGPVATPLYCRWINHVIWEDSEHKLWEVTPYYDVRNHDDTAWAATTFILDREATPQIKPDGCCLMQPARYVATRAEGLDIAKCLNALERDGSRYETYWLQQAVQALKQAGFGSVEWHVERIDGQINNLWLFAN
ncbi:MAG TPA: hypothetical protein VGI40_18230 [Pirellulaceae bacterium]|jgi:hypothetical protein